MLEDLDERLLFLRVLYATMDGKSLHLPADLAILGCFMRTVKSDNALAGMELYKTLSCPDLSMAA